MRERAFGVNRLDRAAAPLGDPRPPVLEQRRERIGSPWNGYGSPGATTGSLRFQLMLPSRCFAYSFDSSP